MISTGIKPNLTLFVRLAVINLFVGSMAGLERTVLPLLGEREFHVSNFSASLSFIVGFGLAKAVMNLAVGHLADRTGRRNVLILGWVTGFFVPFLIYFAPAWWLIGLANILLGINQGLAWSMTLNMKIDIADSSQRGLAIGVNQFAGYFGVAATAALTGFMAQDRLGTDSFYLGAGIAAAGLLLSLTTVNTTPFLGLQTDSTRQASERLNRKTSMKSIFSDMTWRNRNLSLCSLAGLVTNLKDGAAWGLFPFFFSQDGLPPSQVGLLVALYPAAWGIFQLFSGSLSDKWGRKSWIVGGMFLQAAALWCLLGFHQYAAWIAASLLLGIGTAMVYPTLQAAVSDASQPDWRASAMGVYRFWRDSGYVFGAVLSGLLADALNVPWAIGLISVIPFAVGLILMAVLQETLQKKPPFERS